MTLTFWMNNVDILLISETKLHLSFLDAEVFFEDHNKPLQLDVSGRNGGLLVFTKSHLPTRQLTKLKIPKGLFPIFEYWEYPNI